MTLARNTVIPDSDQTKYILLNSVGDMEFLSRPADNSRWNLTDIIITVDTPGTDVVNVTIKSDMNVIAVIPINSSVSNIATSTGLIGNFGEPINVEIDAAVNVHFTASYYQRKDGTMFNPLSDPLSPTDVANITTTLGASTNMLRVAAAGGLEYRTTAQILSDIGAAPLASPTFTGTVTLPTTIASVIKPASDSTTALQLANAAGTAVLTVDTTTPSLSVNLGTNAYNYLYLDSTKYSHGFSLRRSGNPKWYFENGYGTSQDEFRWVNAAGSVVFTIHQNGRAGFSVAPTATVDIAASTTATASLRIRSGTAPTSPNDGDIWNDGTDFNLYGSGLKLHTGVIKPASDSTTALQLTNAAGTAVVAVDTTNSRVTVSGTSHIFGDQGVLDVSVSASGYPIRVAGSSSAAAFYVSTFAGLGTLGAYDWRFFVNNTSTIGVKIAATTGYFGAGLNNTSLTAYVDIAASTTAAASLRIRSGTAPTSPNAGDIWFDGTNLKMYDGTTTRTIFWT